MKLIVAGSWNELPSTPKNLYKSKRGNSTVYRLGRKEIETATYLEGGRTYLSIDWVTEPKGDGLHHVWSCPVLSELQCLAIILLPLEEFQKKASELEIKGG